MPTAHCCCCCCCHATHSYLAHGTATDYMFEVLKVPMSFTWEIYGDEEASYDDCFRMFNPLGTQHFEEVSTMWVKALLQLIELLPTHPATWPHFKELGLARWEAVAPKENATEQQTEAAAAAQAGPPPAPAAASKPLPEPEALLPKEPDVQPQPAQQQQPGQPVMRPPLRPQPPAGQTQQDLTPTQQQQPPPPETPAVAAPVADSKAADALPPPAVVAGVTAGDTDSGTEVRLDEHLGGSTRHTGHDRTLVLINKILPWAIGLGGFTAILYVVTREKGTAYDRLPVRQPSPSRTPARR
jgi:hypothetical protein